MYIYYVYAYLRNKDSKTAKAGTPYYIGKGCGYRAWVDHGHIYVPGDKSNIVILEENLSEDDALSLERFYIRRYGRQDLNTGILLNRNNGGTGNSGHLAPPAWNKGLPTEQQPMYGKKHSDEFCENLSIRMTGNSYGVGNVGHNQPHTVEAKKKIKDNHVGMTGKKQSEKAKRISSELNSKPIVTPEGTFPSMIKAATHYNLSKGAMSYRLSRFPDLYYYINPQN